MRIFFTVCGFAIFTAVLVGQQPASQQDLVNRYCLTCHNDKLQTGGLTLEKVDAAHPARDAETWEKVIRKLRAGLMPPSGAPRPDRATLDTFRASLEASIDQAASERPNPGATALHRLNRTEYANAIRDLLAIDVDVATILPADDSSEGLDNIARTARTIHRRGGEDQPAGRWRHRHRSTIGHLQSPRRSYAGRPYSRAAGRNPRWNCDQTQFPRGW